MIRLPVTRAVRASALGPAEVAIVVPACNEQARIVTCLEALAGQRGVGVPVISLCVNNTSDATAALAEATALRLGLCLLLTEADVGTGGVGRARRIGHAAALRHCPNLRVLLSTDADCIAAPDWARGMARALGTAPVVLGGIAPIRHEAEAMPDSYFAWSEVEDRYATLSIDLARLLDPRGPDGIGLNTAGGASLGLRRRTYRALGGFRSLRSGEDRDIVARALAAGLRPVRAPEAVVAASMRGEGRAPSGMAARVADRIAQNETPLDPALMPLDTMIGRIVGPTFAQALTDPPARPMSRAEAVRDLARLTRCVEDMRALPDFASRRRVLSFNVQRAPEAAAQG